MANGLLGIHELLDKHKLQFLRDNPHFAGEKWKWLSRSPRFAGVTWNCWRRNPRFAGGNDGAECPRFIVKAVMMKARKVGL